MVRIGAVCASATRLPTLKYYPRARQERRKGRERSEKGGGESVRESTCVGSRGLGGGACFVECGAAGERRESEVELGY